MHGEKMPAKSQAQYRLMQAAMHDRMVAEKHGIPKKVAKEYTKKTRKARLLPDKK